jgi:hypothetical protein
MQPPRHSRGSGPRQCRYRAGRAQDHDEAGDHLSYGARHSAGPEPRTWLGCCGRGIGKELAQGGGWCRRCRLCLDPSGRHAGRVRPEDLGARRCHGDRSRRHRHRYEADNRKQGRSRLRTGTAEEPDVQSDAKARGRSEAGFDGGRGPAGLVAGPGGGRIGERTNQAWQGQEVGFYYGVVDAMLKAGFNREEIRKVGGGLLPPRVRRGHGLGARGAVPCVYCRCRRNRHSVDTARPRLDGHAAKLLLGLVELTGIEPVTS